MIEIALSGPRPARRLGVRVVAFGLSLALGWVGSVEGTLAGGSARHGLGRKPLRYAHPLVTRTLRPWSRSAYPAPPPWARRAHLCWGNWTRYGFVCAGEEPTARPRVHVRPHAPVAKPVPTAGARPVAPASEPIRPSAGPAPPTPPDESGPITGPPGQPAAAAPATPAAPGPQTPPASPTPPTSPIGQAVPATFPLVDPHNLYSETVAGRLSAAVADALPRAYVPNVASNTVVVIDTTTLKVVERFTVGLNPQHVVPSWDLKTLWVANDAERTKRGSVTPIDPKTGVPGRAVPVDDPYNMYFTPDGRSAIIVAEALKRLDFRDPLNMALQDSLPTPECAGINHSDVSIDSKYAIYTCEFGGALAKIDLVDHKVIGYLKLSRGGMPQDIRISPDGKVFYVADMMSDGVVLVDGDSFTEIGFIPTGVGTHGLYPSRDGKKLYVSNRGSNRIRAKPHGPGSVSVIDFATRTVDATWPIPGGGSPDMGNVSADGKQLWLSGRFDNVVYVFDTATGSVTTIPVDHEPHGLAVWPQPGRYSLGHTGVMR